MAVRAVAVAGLAIAIATSARADQTAGWGAYGGDPGGTRYSALTQINRGNVAKLKLAWSMRTGDFQHQDGTQKGPPVSCSRCHQTPYKFEATPILADGRLYVSTPFNRVVAIEPTSGRQLWRWDAKLDLKLDRNEGFVSRGVAYWEDIRAQGACHRRIFFGTVDARLVALDATTGLPCPGFGTQGTVRVDQDVGKVEVGQYGITSPPVVIGDLVAVGSSIGDNRGVDLEHGVVHAFDARTGQLRWAWDPIPRRPNDPGWRDWDPKAAARTGAANAWAPLSVDVERGLVFVPTGSAAPDYFGGERPGNNRYANSVVALEAKTGKPVWDFQTVHHDLWDYDVSSQPSLIELARGGKMIPAVVTANKAGFVFVLDRVTGQPLFPVEERPVPASTIPGERASPTQPFPSKPRPLHPLGITAADVWGLSPKDLAACRASFKEFKTSAMFAPPSLEGTLMYPGFGGGINWGGFAFASDRQLLIVNTLRLPMWVRLAKRASATAGNQVGTPYTMSRGMFVAPSGLPCVKPPWGMLTAIDLRTGEIRWEVPLGMMKGLETVPHAAEWGSVNFGGPIVTAGGLVFISAATDEYLRAFDAETGKELWKIKLPAGGQATPMTYQVGGKQYLVIAAGGHSAMGTTLGDHLLAFALPN